MTDNSPASVEPSSSEPVGSEPVGSEPPRSDPAGSEPSSSAASGASKPEIADNAEPSNAEPSAAAPSVPPRTTRRRVPWWAWALILGLPLLSLSGIASALLGTMLVGQATQALLCYADGYCGVRGGAAPTPVSPAGPNGGAAATDRVTLDRQAAFDGQPEWAIRLEPTWQAISFDQNGINVFQDETTGCLLITSQRLALPDPQAFSDAAPSNTLLFEELSGLTGGDPEAFPFSPGATDIAVHTVDSGSVIEFASATMDHKNADGISESIEIVARSMPASESELVAVLTCTADAMETFGTKFELFSTALAVTATP